MYIWLHFNIFRERRVDFWCTQNKNIDIIPHAIACAIPHSIAEGNSVSTFAQ